MSIMSLQRTGDSGLTYKLFSSLISTYIDSRESTKKSMMLIPLGNIFRLLEMYRYDAFTDRSQTSVLATNNFDDIDYHYDNTWHIPIKEALSKALTETYGISNSKKEEVAAILEIEQILRSLSSDFQIEEERTNRAKIFFENFSKSLP